MNEYIVISLTKRSDERRCAILALGRIHNNISYRTSASGPACYHVRSYVPTKKGRIYLYVVNGGSYVFTSSKSIVYNCIIVLVLIDRLF